MNWLKSWWGKFSTPGRITPEEIEGALHLPVLAIIPHIERRRGLLPSHGPVMRRIDLEGRWRSRLLIHYPKDLPASVSYSNFAKELLAKSHSHRQKIWLFASSVAGEGTSLTCMNLAISAGRLGIKTLIIEGHTRSPRISSVFHLELEPGLTGCLNRSVTAAQAIRKSDVAGVDVLPAGRPVPYSETLWAAPAFHRLLAEVRSMYELVIFEGPPVLLYQDVPMLADKVDGIVLVHQFGRTSPQRIEKILAKLGDRQQHLLGIVLNDVPTATH